jgi:hypothetical protein
MKLMPSFGEWVGGGEESSASSSDESIKRLTTRTNKGASSSSNFYLVAKPMESESNVSDDDSDSPSIDELLDLIHEQQKAIRKQSKEIKQLNSLNNLNATLVTNYDDLLCKLKLLNKEHEVLKLKIVSTKNETIDFLEMEQSIPCAISNSKVDASTSCNDLIDDSCSHFCNEKCFENSIVETCDDLMAKKNDELK